MFVSNDYTEIQSLDGNKYKIPTNVFYHLKEAKNRQKSKLDNVIVITGSVGSGKSNGSKGIKNNWENI